jgi:antitoxin component YwqK of YwqJK toxin-antitoxin module
MLRPFLVIISLFIYCSLQLLGQSTLPPVQSTWHDRDSYGRVYDTKIVKERYNTNENGQKHGLYIKYKTDGKTIDEKGKYISGKKHGSWIEGVENGEYVNGQRDGKWVRQLSSCTELYFSNGNLTKQIGYFNSECTIVRLVEQFVNGKHHGNYVRYAEDGTIISQGMYIGGLKEGEWLEYGNDLISRKMVLAAGKYVNDQRNGEWNNLGVFYKDLTEADGKWEATKVLQSWKRYQPFEEKVGPKYDWVSLWEAGTLIREYPKSGSEQRPDHTVEMESDEANPLESQEKTDVLTLKSTSEDNVATYRMDQKGYESLRTLPLSKDEKLYVGFWEFKSGPLQHNSGKSILSNETFYIAGTREITYDIQVTDTQGNILEQRTIKGIWSKGYYDIIQIFSQSPNEIQSIEFAFKVTGNRGLRTISFQDVSTTATIESKRKSLPLLNQ